MRKIAMLLLLLSGCPAQEICNDLEDNDLDLLVDCGDPDCSEYAECSGDYL